MRDTISAILKRDYRVLTVSSGEAALALLKREDVDLDAPRRPTARDQRPRRPADRQGELQPHRADHDLGGHRDRGRRAGDEARRVPLHHEGLRLRRAAVARPQRERASGSEPAGHDAQRAGRRAVGQGVPDRSEPRDARHRRPGPQGGQALGDGPDPRARAAPGRSCSRGCSTANRDAASRRSSRSTWPRSRTSSSKARSSATRKGAFTGAHRQQLGKFELAAGGTLFLDEIGDLRLDLQAKLLRAIQEGEIERVGGSKPIKTDFRLVVATNVDLEKAVKDGRFRDDLFYRINVIPIRMPPLRERIEDLPALAKFFFERYTAQVPQADARHLGIDDEDPVVVLVAWQHPRAREPDRAARRRERQGMDHGRGSAARLPLRPVRCDAGRRERERSLYQEALDTFDATSSSGRSNGTTGTSPRPRDSSASR